MNATNMTDYPILMLKLPIRIENALLQSGIKNLSDLSNKNEKEIYKVRNLGCNSIQIISNSIIEFIFNETKINAFTHYSFNFNQSTLLLSKALDSKNNIKNSLYKNHDLSLETYSENLAKWIFQSIHDICNSKRQQILLNKRLRFLTKNSFHITLTLDEIGNLPDFQTTRERVRQIEKKFLNKIEGLIFSFNLQHENEYCLFSNSLDQIFKEVKVLSWPDEVDFLIKKCFFNTNELSKRFFIFFFELELNKNKNIHFLRNQNDVFVVYSNSFDKKEISRKIKELSNYLNRSKKVSIKENVLIKTVFPQNNLTQDEIFILRKIISKISNYRYLSNDQYQKKNLNVEDYAYQILSENKNPMHFTEIALRIEQITKKKRSVVTIHNALGVSDIIHGVGNGKYALKEWKMPEINRVRYDNSLSVKNLVENYIKNNGKSQNTKIAEYVLSKRKASIYTINQAICEINKKYGYSNQNTEISTLIIDYIENNGPSTLEEIYKNLAKKKSGLTKEFIYRYLYRSQYISKANDRWFLSSYYLEKIRNKDSRITIREKLISYLRTNKPATLDEIFDNLSKKTKVSRNTIKDYLSDMGIKADKNQKYSL